MKTFIGLLTSFFIIRDTIERKSVLKQDTNDTESVVNSNKSRIENLINKRISKEK